MKFIYIIANSKEKVFPQYYPFEIADITLTDQVENIFIKAGLSYINPISVLRNNERCYYQTDTHWSDEGAYIAFEKTLQTLSEKNPIISPKFKGLEVMGDLGSKLNPVQSSMRSTFIPNFKIDNFLVFSHDISGTGAIRIFENLKIGNDKSILIFGGSSMADFSKFLICSFRRVVTINLPGCLVEDIVDYEKPDILILQTNERYLAKPGICYESFQRSPLNERLSNSSILTKEKIVKALSSINCESFYRENILKAIEQ